ncbi:MAG: flavodoxin-dependent (E)-4-hydroxy-3-methylbut-2-enyl-diphosphate synthase [Corallococcus sp.]|nr:flavodoxin-dependent (E)-4-hydroxy-3-methylbut-2-enyl-diphosphate synthase [Bacillota bacterium]MCM1534133.1 flavodoxin-dependent (E)-4-hydroxy-3-methylbut-2-enyl-diphosphate synthase [Corallococcus sp.]
MTKEIKIGNITIGGGNNVAIQSMTSVSVCDTDGTLEQIEQLRKAGCDIVRVAVPTKKAADAFAVIRKHTDAPLVSDIHFDAELAIKTIESGADKTRINPGNMPLKQLDRVIDCAKMHGVPVRIGVNGGSINKDILSECDGDRSKALAESTFKYVAYFESRGFDDLVLSVKSSDVKEMIRANRLISRLPYPLHLGVTEAGLIRQGLIKNSVGIGALLLDGIGDTVRVSLTADPTEEVYAARDLLVALGLRKGVNFVSCPTCGRCSVKLEEVAVAVYKYVANTEKSITVAVMGCEVNGPGECKEADIGMAGSNGSFAFFKNGKVYKRVVADEAVEEFKKEIDLMNK